MVVLYQNPLNVVCVHTKTVKWPGSSLGSALQSGHAYKCMCEETIVVFSKKLHSEIPGVSHVHSNIAWVSHVHSNIACVSHMHSNIT